MTTKVGSSVLSTTLTGLVSVSSTTFVGNLNGTCVGNLNGTWSQLPTGTRIPFAQAAAPTGWTQDTTDNANNRMLRVVDTAGNGVGGSSSPILNNTVPAHIHGGITNTENAYHTHVDSGHTHVVGIKQARPVTGSSALYNALDGGVAGTSYTQSSSANLGTESALHAHDFTTGSQTNSGNWTPRYIDMIICAKT